MKKLELCTEPEAKVLVTMTGRHLNAVRSTSAGRLFDGVSAILGIRKVALSGGVFQNRLLLRLVEEGLVKQGLITLHHHLIPPNDGGLSLGQAAYAMAYLQKHEIK